MPWGPQDAARHNKKVRSRPASLRWSKIANAVLKESGDDGKAIRIANADAKKPHVGVRRRN